MYYQQAIITLSLVLTGTRAQCVGPDINAASVDLIKSFESWQPDICMWQFCNVLLEILSVLN